MWGKKDREKESLSACVRKRKKYIGWEKESEYEKKSVYMWERKKIVCVCGKVRSREIKCVCVKERKYVYYMRERERTSEGIWERETSKMGVYRIASGNWEQIIV